MASFDERYAVFKRLPDGAPLWVSPERDLDVAKKKIAELSAKDNLEYFVHDFTLGRIVVRIRGEKTTDA